MFTVKLLSIKKGQRFMLYLVGVWIEYMVIDDANGLLKRPKIKTEVPVVCLDSSVLLFLSDDKDVIPIGCHGE